MLADDDPDVIEVVSILLEDEGYEVITAANGMEALELMQAERPDLVILDLLMPRLDGFGVFGALQDPANRAWSGMPVVVLTSVREEVSKRRFELETGGRMGYSAYLEKPVEPDLLLETVSSLLSD